MTEAPPPSIHPTTSADRPRTAGGRSVSSKAGRPTPPSSGPVASGPSEPAVEEEVRVSGGGSVQTDLPSSSDDEEQEPPSPLVVAVDATSTWLKKVGGAATAKVSSAYSAVTHPVPEDAAMTASPTVAPESVRPVPVPPVGTPSVASSAPRPAARPVPSGPRRVRLAVSRVDPWSAMKLSFLLSVAAGVMLVIATAVVWGTLNGMHVFTRINDLITTIVGAESSIDLLSYVAFDKVLSAATLVGVLDVFLLTALGTIGAFLYNIVSALVGGLHLTMTDE